MGDALLINPRRLEVFDLVNGGCGKRAGDNVRTNLTSGG